MLDHAREAVALAGDSTRADLPDHRLLELALVRLVEVVGEAASRISDECRAMNPQIPWREVASMRNRLAHGYDAVDLDVLWDTIGEDLPALIGQLESVLENRGED